MKKIVPKLRSNAAAEKYLAHLDFSQFKPAHFEFEKKSARVNMRLPETLLKAVKARATARKIPYQRFIRQSLERAVARRK